MIFIIFPGCNQSPLCPPASHRDEHGQRGKWAGEDLPGIQGKVCNLKRVAAYARAHTLSFFSGQDWLFHRFTGCSFSFVPYQFLPLPQILKSRD